VCASASSEVALPALPFPPEEVLLPGATKKLHLYEARFLALLDAARGREGECADLFCHAVLLPVSEDPFGGGGGGYVRAAHCAVGRVLEVERLGVGCLVTVRGEAPAQVTSLARAGEESPFLHANLTLAEDAPFDAECGGEEVAEAAALALRETLGEVVALAERVEALKAPPESALGEASAAGALKAALAWAEAAEPVRLGGRRWGGAGAATASFAALHAAPEASDTERRALLERQLAAIEERDVDQRIRLAVHHAEEARAALAAKASLLALNLA